jgi:hypothetical protein
MVSDYLVLRKIFSPSKGALNRALVTHASGMGLDFYGELTYKVKLV